MKFTMSSSGCDGSLSVFDFFGQGICFGLPRLTDNASVIHIEVSQYCMFLYISFGFSLDGS